MDDSPEDIFRSELSTGEQLLWAGRPPLGLMVRAADIFLIPFSLLWGGSALYWEAIALTQGAPWFAALWGVLFVLIGLYIMLGRFWVDAQQRAQTFYAVTSERVVIVSGWLARKVKSFAIDTLTDLSLSERSSGGGAITFGVVLPGYEWFVGTGWPGVGHGALPRFELPGNAREVYETIRKSQRAAKQRYASEGA